MGTAPITIVGSMERWYGMRINVGGPNDTVVTYQGNLVTIEDNRGVVDWLIPTRRDQIGALEAYLDWWTK